jgi:hypothetical protein
VTLLYVTVPAVAFLLLAAHFLRAQNIVVATACVLIVSLVFVRRPWAARVMQAALLLGSLEWLLATIVLVRARIGMGEPYLRAALILGAVGLVTAGAALVFETRRLRARYGLAPADSPEAR